MDIPTLQNEKIPRAAIKMASFVGSVIRASTIANATMRQTAVPCRRDRGKHKCSGSIFVQRQDIPTDNISWSCNQCSDGGVISGWRKSRSNLTDFAELDGFFPRGVTHILTLTRCEYRALLDSDIFDPECERAVLEAKPLAGSVLLSILDDDLEYFVETLAPLCRYEKNRTRARHLDAVIDKCFDLLDAQLELLV